MLGLASLLGGCPPTIPPTPNPANPNHFCYEQFTPIPAVPNPPTIDGNLNDLGWASAFRYIFSNGTNAPDAIMQGLRDDPSNSLYLSFEVHNDETLEPEDAILLVFSPGVSASNDRRILIFPVQQNVISAVGSHAQDIWYWTKSGDWNTRGSTPGTTTDFVVKPAWLDDNIRVSSQNASATSKTWYVEMRIPITTVASTGAATDTGINLPSGSDFGFYVDIIRAKTDPVTMAQTANDLPWPPGVTLGSGSNSDLLTPDENTPIPSAWGKATRSATGACNGVSFAWNDIVIAHPASTTAVPDDVLSLNQGNVFKVTAHNDSVNATSTPVPAQAVFGRFRIANFGLQSGSSPLALWDDVPSGYGNAPAVDVPAATATLQGTAALSGPSSWVLNATEQANYSFPNDHQCILAELDSKTDNTTFKNKSAYRNMNFKTTASPFRDAPMIDMRGYKRGRTGDQLEFLVSSYAYNTDPRAPWRTDMPEAQRVGRDEYLVRGRPGARTRVPLVVTPPNIALPSQDMRVPPGSGGTKQKPIVLRVVPGDLVTLIADGSVSLRRGREDVFRSPSGPEGIDVTVKNAEHGYLLPDNQAPYTRVGALVGSWDEFHATSFVVGRGATVKVPPDARMLFLAINDSPQGYAEHQGPGFHVQAIETPLHDYYTLLDSRVARDSPLETTPLPLAANLPTLVQCGRLRTGQKLVIKGKTFDYLENIGCYGYAINRIGAEHPAERPVTRPVVRPEARPAADRGRR